MTKTLTKTITYSSAYTVTEVVSFIPSPATAPARPGSDTLQVPVTQTKEVEYTVDVTVGSGATVTQPSLTIVYATHSVVQTQSQAPVTVVQPTTSTSTTAGSVVTAAADANNAPAAAFIVGVIGAVMLV